MSYRDEHYAACNKAGEIVEELQAKGYHSRVLVKMWETGTPEPKSEGTMIQWVPPETEHVVNRDGMK